MLVFAAVLAPAGAAQADNVFVDDFPQYPGTQNRVDVWGPAGGAHELTAPQFNLTWSGLQHLEPGSQVKVSMDAGGPENITAADQTFTVPSTWSSTSPAFTFRPKLNFTMPETLGWHEQYVSFTVTGTCADGFGECVAGNPLIVHVHSESRPHPVSDAKAAQTADNSAIDVSWTDSPSISQLTSYRVDRYAPDFPAERSKWWHGLDKSQTTFRDTTAEPGKRYCYFVTAWWEDDALGRSGSSTRSETVCTRINRAPTAPGAPNADPSLSNGPTTLSWTPATDPDGDGVMYEIERRDKNDADWSPYPFRGFSSSSLRIGESGGTYVYRVRGFDNDGAYGPWSEVGSEFKADTTGPGVPKVGYDKTPSDNGWFKDSVTLSFSDAVDSPLPDGSEGGGVADDAYPEPVTFSTHGEHTVRPQVHDRVGNGGAMVTTYVNVDTRAPVVAFDDDECPTEVMQDSALTLRYTASDEGSGLAGDATGTVDADTSTVGPRTEKITVRDRVGHETTAECTFDVYRNSPPTAVANLRSSEPNSGDGDFSISWDPSTDPDGDPVDYTIEAVGSAAPLAERHEATTYNLEDVPEGTHTYRITAFDNPRRLHEGAAEVTVKVDKTAPGAPQGRTDRAADYEDWFKDRVEVTFSGSDDPDLADGTPGSGVADDGYSATEVLTASGISRGTATDRAGNKSEDGTHPVKVDATAPRIATDGCPAEAVLERTPVTVRWDASDDESGLRSLGGGDIPVDTHVPGVKRVEIPVAVDNVGHETTKVCEFEVYANTAPDAPTGLVDPASPRANGDFDLSWDKAHDPDLGAGDSITYTVQQRDSDDDEWTTVDGLTALTRHVDVDGGTWQFRVRTVDSFGAASPWSDFSPVKVDDRAPTQPTLTTSPAAATNGWFKDSVTVSFSGSEDPKLGDGSDGAGGIRYTADRTFSETGTHLVPGTATDAVDNVSAPLDPVPAVKVDADAPTVDVDCPTGTLTVGQPATATWIAKDVGSGVATPENGTIALDTSAPGTHTRSEQDPIRDLVGHEIPGASCSYKVAYKFVGFLAPINGNAVNVGKTGRTYPIKWRLQRHDGSLISDAEAQALVPAMSAGDRTTDCNTFSLLPEDVLEEADTGGTQLRYDAGADQFIYNYKAPSTLGCYVLGVRKADGHNTKQVNFTFTR